MRSKGPLSGMTILDFTQRLPGPLASKVLKDLGAVVIKIEGSEYNDPFLDGIYKNVDPSFEYWYRQLNAEKEILRLDFSSPEIAVTISNLLDRCQGVLLGPSLKINQYLGLTAEELKRRKGSLGVVNLLASKNHGESLHDLNALGLSGVLSLYVADRQEDIINPPFLPFAGMAFGQNVATHLLAAIWQSLQIKKVVIHTTYLLQTIQEIFSAFWTPSFQMEAKTSKYLHNGAFPCYSLYKTKDAQYVALAAVEEKYWNGILEIFQIPLKKEERFSRNKDAFQKVADEFQKFTLAEIERKVEGKNLCLTSVKKYPPSKI